MPYGFVLSETIEYDETTFIPYRNITHPLYPDKIFRFSPEYVQDIYGPYGVIDGLPAIEKALSEVFGYELFFRTDVYFPNYPKREYLNELGEKRVFSIDFETISDDKIDEYFKLVETKMKNNKEKVIDVENELIKILQNELVKIWEETPVGYNETNNAYHIGKGIMVNKETWDKYLVAKQTNEELTPLDYAVGTVKEVYEKMKNNPNT